MCLGLCRPLLPADSKENDVDFSIRLTKEAGVTTIPVGHCFRLESWVASVDVSVCLAVSCVLYVPLHSHLKVNAGAIAM